MRKLTTDEAMKLFGGRPAPRKSSMRKVSNEEAKKLYGGRPVMIEMTVEELDSVKAGLPLSARTGRGW